MDRVQLRHLSTLFRSELRQTFRGSQLELSQPVQEDLRTYNEDTLELILAKFVMPTVNYALAGQRGQCHYGAGSRCGRVEIKPDWSLISPGINHSVVHRLTVPVNLIPGNTKLHRKWEPEMRELFQRAAAWPGRSRQRQISDVSMQSAGSVYEDTDPLNWTCLDPENVCVPWSNSGCGRLTEKLALWFLAMIAVNDRCLDYFYPLLNSWRSGATGGYVHNSSGAKKAKLQREEPAAGPSNWAQAARASHKAYHSHDASEDPQFSQAAREGSAYGYEVADENANHPEDEEEEDKEDNDDDGGEHDGEANDEDDSEYHGEGHNEGEDFDYDHTEVPVGKRVQVTLKKHRLSPGYYFEFKGKKRDTERSDWTKVGDEHELRGRKHTY
ncbi:hypothetical protein C8A03DRAFT_39333, partial [Achaetomium macrosporum]